MNSRRLAGIAFALALPMTLPVALPGTAWARGHRHHAGTGYDPSVGYAVPLQRVFQYPAALVDQPTWPTGYAVPLQGVYQFPAALVEQPGAFVPFAAPASSHVPTPGYLVLPR